MFYFHVLVHTPAHSQLSSLLTYASEVTWPSGTLVKVPLGSREVIGIVWAETTVPDDLQVRPITAVLSGIEPLPAHWLDLVKFTARYYQRSLGEVAVQALPNQLRDLSLEQWQRKLKKWNSLASKLGDTTVNTIEPPPLTSEQASALLAMQQARGPFVLFGSTGSGKTEVYLRQAQHILSQDSTAQVLIMVPEINLTPQLQARFESRFNPIFGAQCLVSLHSGLTPAQRLSHWLSAHTGQARIVLGTRMAVFASIPHLKLIIVDEEHDPSYKQQDGARYSARDLAVYRGQLQQAQVILGSATPSLESWHQSRPATDSQEAGRYMRLAMPSRVGHAPLAQVRIVDMTHQPKRTVLCEALKTAIAQRIERREQVLLVLNRRGYAPVLRCPDCDWKSACAHCSAFQVFHKSDRTLRCHHCGWTQAVPHSCPSCGNFDIQPLGSGTEQLQEHLTQWLSGIVHPNGHALRIARIDADTTRHKGELEAQLNAVHAGEVDVLVGTQMIAKGHDFRRVTLVAALNADGALFSSDFRAPERLFSLLMQAAGRAGRDATHSTDQACEMWVQTFYPAHPLFDALKRHDFAQFAQQQLLEREQASLPPFSYQAVLRAEARTQAVAQDFLNDARTLSDELAVSLGVDVFPAVAMTIQRVANVERSQMVIECPMRGPLMQFLRQWADTLHAIKPQHKGLIRWAIDVDPLSI